MSFWTIQPLYFGYTSGKTADQKDCSIPWMGFFLTDGKMKILCDTGVKDGFFVDGKSPFGFPSAGDEAHVRKALDKIGVRPEEIEMVIYTHFHWDHAGNCHLFPKATHVFQDQEWKEMLDPLPSMQFLKVYDQRVIPEFEKLRCRRIFGRSRVSRWIGVDPRPRSQRGRPMSARKDPRRFVYHRRGFIQYLFHGLSGDDRMDPVGWNSNSA